MYGLFRRNMAINKDMQLLMKEAKDQGWFVELTRGGHYKWQSPSGNLVFSSQTPSDYRAVQNLKRDLRMYGFIELKVKKKGRRQ